MKKISILITLCLFFVSTAFALIELDRGNTRFIAAVVSTEDGVEVWLNTRVHWETDECLTDGYSSEEREEVEKITDQVNLCELQESIYHPCRDDRTVEEVKIDLMKAGVEIDQKFQEWAKEIVTSEM